MFYQNCIIKSMQYVKISKKEEKGENESKKWKNQV